MIFMNDIWINWFEGEDKGYNVCSFYEWRKEDDIQLIDRIPILHVEEQLYQYIENDLDDLPKKLLSLIENQTIVKGKREKYATIVTDGVNVLVFDTLGYSIPLRKSRLIPRHERHALRLIRSMPKQTFPLKIKKERKTDHIFSLASEVMYGLTRRERELKQLTMMALDQLREGNNLSEVRYWLTEWEPEQYDFICKLSFQAAWKKIFQHLYRGWSKKHEEFCQEFVKGNLLFEQLWKNANQTTNQTSIKRIK